MLESVRECVSFRIIRTDTAYHLELSDLIAQGHCLVFHGIVEIELHIDPT